jgi:hypothetical protein
MKKNFNLLWDSQMLIGLLMTVTGLFLFMNGVVQDPPLAKLIGQVSGLILACVGLLVVAQRYVLRKN